jgi:hypothetical protein
MGMIILASAAIPNIYQRLRVVNETSDIAQDYLEGRMEEQRSLAFASIVQKGWTDEASAIMGRTVKYRVTVSPLQYDTANNYVLITASDPSNPSVKRVTVEVEAKYRDYPATNLKDSFLVGN